MSTGPTMGQRIKAAKELGGFESLDTLARDANLPNLSGKSLRRSANDQRDLQEHELERIAAVCGLTVAFFTVDFARLPELDEQATVTPAAPPASLDDIVDAVLRRLEERERLEPPGRLGRLHEDDQPTGADRPAAEHPRAEDSR